MYLHRFNLEIQIAKRITVLLYKDVIMANYIWEKYEGGLGDGIHDWVFEYPNLIQQNHIVFHWKPISGWCPFSYITSKPLY